MPTNKYAYIRYRIIDKALNNKFKRYPSLMDLKTECEKILGAKLSDSTIQKDIEAMRYDEGLGFEAPIHFDRAEKGYYYSNPEFSIEKMPLKDIDLETLRYATGILEQFDFLPPINQLTASLTHFLDAGSDFTNYQNDAEFPLIQFERSMPLEGLQFIPVLIKAITTKSVTKVVYRPFTKESDFQLTLHPYLLKEYRNRWYLVAFNQEINALRIYGLDRVQSVDVSTQSFTVQSGFSPREYFKYAFGITVKDHRPIRLVMKVYGLAIEYLKAQPIHHSQNISHETETIMTLELHVYPSEELMMMILSYGEQVEVVEPVEIRDEIHQRLRQGVIRYVE